MNPALGAQAAPTYSNQGPSRPTTSTGGKITTTNNNETASQTTTSLAHALLPDLPLLMHGSGDVLPEHVNPKSVAVLAQLTEQYIGSLVSAALDAHDIFTDGEIVGGGACLGIPPFAAASNSYYSDGEEEDIIHNTKVDDTEETIRKRKRAEKGKISKKFKQRKIDYWDQPLPEVSRGGGGDEDSSSSDSDSSDEGSDVETSDLSTLQGGDRRKKSGFIGAVPVDLYAHQRTRDYYVSAPTVMDVRSFIFPICHDADLYQRVKEMQKNRRAICRDMMDHTLLEAIQEEGANIGRMDVSEMWNSVLASAVGAAAAEEEATLKSGNSNAANNSDVTKSKQEKKSVDAGLVDSNIKASWPGMNSLERGRLW